MCINFENEIIFFNVINVYYSQYEGLKNKTRKNNQIPYKYFYE